MQFSECSKYIFVKIVNLNFIDSSMLGIKRVESSFNLPSIVPASEEPTLVNCLLKAYTLFFLSVSCLFSNSTIAMEVSFGIYEANLKAEIWKTVLG